MFLIVLSARFAAAVDTRDTRMLTQPAISESNIAFIYANDLWLAKLDGSYRVAEAMIANEARRRADLNREQLITRIVQRFDRHGR